MRFHLLGIPHTASSKRWVACAFTQKVVTLAAMLHRRGHQVIHYGNELSELECDENVVVTCAEDIKPPEAFLDYDLQSPVYRRFTTNAVVAIEHRKQPGDFLLCPWGAGHKPIADAHPDLLVCESGIGYPGGWFAPFRAFESYAILHAAYGTEAIRLADRMRWYDVVIPNAYDPADFRFSEQKGNYLLFLGMRHHGVGKGVQVAIDAAGEAGYRLIVAGPDQFESPPPAHVLHAGLLNVQQRADLLAHARAVIAPSLFLEPFCGAMVESFFSGTPVISSDWGAFSENNLHGVTGFRCRTHSEFVWAIQHADRIDPKACRTWAENFTLERVGAQYEDFFQSVLDVKTGRGWYEPRPERTDLASLRRQLPTSQSTGAWTAGFEWTRDVETVKRPAKRRARRNQAKEALPQ